MTLFILMIIKKEDKNHFGVDGITNLFDIGNGIDDGTNDIVMMEDIINTSMEEKMLVDNKAESNEDKVKESTGIDDFVKYVLPIFEQKEKTSQPENENQKKIDHTKDDKDDKFKLINGPARGFIDGLLTHKDMKIMIPRLARFWLNIQFCH
jgi:hypothetical protein